MQESRRDGFSESLGSSPVHYSCDRHDAGGDRHEHRSRLHRPERPEAPDLRGFDRHDPGRLPGRTAPRRAHRDPLQPDLAVRPGHRLGLEHRSVRCHRRRDRFPGRHLGLPRRLPLPAGRRPAPHRSGRARDCDHRPAGRPHVHDPAVHGPERRRLPELGLRRDRRHRRGRFHRGGTVRIPSAGRRRGVGRCGGRRNGFHRRARFCADLGVRVSAA